MKFNLVFECSANDYGILNYDKISDTSTQSSFYSVFCESSNDIARLFIEKLNAVPDDGLVLLNTTNIRLSSICYIQMLNFLKKTPDETVCYSAYSDQINMRIICAVGLTCLKLKDIIMRVNFKKPFLEEVVQYYGKNVDIRYLSENTDYKEKDCEVVQIVPKVNKKDKLIQKWIDSGVIFEAPLTVVIDETVQLNKGTRIGAFVALKGDTIIESEAIISEFSYIQNSYIGKDTEIWNSTIIDSTIQEAVTVGPYAFIRGKCIIHEKSQIGAYSEINDTVMETGSKCKHFSYIGHTQVGKNVNIGAGTITCTYDGVKKYNSSIGNGAFVGSGTLIVAPINIGEGAKTGAGSVLTHDVPKSSLVYGVPARVREKKV